MLTLARALAGDFQLLMIGGLTRLGADHRPTSAGLVPRRPGATSAYCWWAAHRIALNFSDRAIVLRRGDIVLEGESADLRGHVGQITDAFL